MIVNESQIEILRAGGKILAEILCEVQTLVRPGVSTRALDAHARELMKQRGVQPSFLVYRGYPAVLCTSLNEETVHAIASDPILQDGDLLKIDIGIIHEGLHTDMAVSVLVTDSKISDPSTHQAYREKLKMIRI